MQLGLDFEAPAEEVPRQKTASITQLTPLEYKALVKAWDEKLRASGFKDIESRNQRTGELLLKSWDSHCFQEHDPTVFEIKANYYYRAAQFLNSHKFKSQTDRHIWQMHTEGLGVRVIAESLKTAGVRTNKDYVAAIVSRFKKAMQVCEEKI